jgi:hypothetical protein
MKKSLFTIFFVIILIQMTPMSISQVSFGELPETGHNKVAYYAFDATPVNQGKLRLTNFTDKANIIILFEGNIFELCDSVHYGKSSSYILTINGGPYKYYKQILNDVQLLRSKGIKVLMNVDDTKAWSTAVPFTTWDGKQLNYQQYAAFIDSCITAIGLDGISLDIEHSATDNAYYRNLIIELGKYAGPLSSNSRTRIYTAAIYLSSYGVPGPTVIGYDKSVAAYLNFVMDMGYFQDNNKRFKRWADSLGNSKVMIGFSHDDANNPLSVAAVLAAWHPVPDKAGIMVFAGNVNKLYTDSIFTALESSFTGTGDDNKSNTIPGKFALLQNYPNPFNPSTVISFQLPVQCRTTLKIYDITGKEVKTLIDGILKAGTHQIQFNAVGMPSGMYFYKLNAGSFTETKKLIYLR